MKKIVLIICILFNLLMFIDLISPITLLSSLTKHVVSILMLEVLILLVISVFERPDIIKREEEISIFFVTSIAFSTILYDCNNLNNSEYLLSAALTFISLIFLSIVCKIIISKIKKKGDTK